MGGLNEEDRNRILLPGMCTNKMMQLYPSLRRFKLSGAVLENKGGVGMSGTGSGGYRSRGRTAGQEMDDAQNAMLVSKSVAQEKLKAHAAKRGIITHQQPEKRILSLNGYKNGRPRGRTTDKHLATWHRLLKPHPPVNTAPCQCQSPSDILITSHLPLHPQPHV